ncbi:transposase [Sodalis sp. RH16]|uniref:transposase n=1 Tax=Sodalis sp. RH16 TaxID=3394331 RepID=UPI0039B67452
MDKQPSTSSRHRLNFPLKFKISFVEQSLKPGVSIAQLARANGINDNYYSIGASFIAKASLVFIRRSAR